MAQVITFEGYTPVPRYDSIPWTEARIYEAVAEDSLDADWTLIETITLSPVDADPANPASRDFTTELATAEDLWYRIVFADANGDVLVPTLPVQNVSDTTTAYSTVSELFRILQIRAPTAAQTAAAERVLLAAAGEIDSELGRDTGLSGWQVALAEEVALERAVEHWHQLPLGFNVVGLDTESPMRLPRDSWDRHAHKLAPLKESWGLA